MSERVHTLFERRSLYQEVHLGMEADGHVTLTLDDYFQFDSRDEYVFHELLSDLAVTIAPKIERALVLGGGDALALRNLLRYPALGHATLCELDPVVLEMTRRVPEMRELSERALEDKRVQVVVGDGLEFLEADPGLFDLIICDFPAWTSPEYARLFSPAFFRTLAKSLAPEGVLCTQVSLEPPIFWEVLNSVGSAFEWVHPLLARLQPRPGEDEAWADFILASPGVRQVERPLAPEVRFVDERTLATHRIKNRAGHRFETDAFGREPDFDAP